MEDLAGGDAALNAAILADAFGGARGPVADALNLNAGVALAACEVAATPAEGVAMAQVPLLPADVRCETRSTPVVTNWGLPSHATHTHGGAPCCGDALGTGQGAALPCAFGGFAQVPCLST